MLPSVLLRPILLFAAASPAAAFFHSKVPPKVPREQVQQYTDDEFQTVVSVAGDSSDDIKKAQGFFNDKLKRSKTEAFRGEEVERVGPSVAGLVDASKKYWDAIRAARNSDDVYRARVDFKATLANNGVALPLAKAAVAQADATMNKHLSEAMTAAGNGVGSLGQNLIRDSTGDDQDGRHPGVGQGELGIGWTRESELVRMALEATRKALAEKPTPEPSRPPAGGVQPPYNGGVPDGGRPPSVPTTGEIIGINDPASPADAITDARERYRNGDVSGGIGDATRAIELGGGAAAYALRGGMLLDQRQYGAASADARQALQLDPRNAEASAVLHFSEGRVEGSADGSRGGAAGAREAPGGRSAPTGGAEYGRAVNRAPSAQAADARKAAAAALALGDASGARAAADRLVALDPNDPSARNLRASAYARSGMYSQAVMDARAGLALAPGNRALLRTLAYSELRGKDPKGALATANELLALDPADAYALAMRAHAYGEMGERDAMMSDIRRAAQLDPRFQEAAERAANLQLPSDSDVLFLFPGEFGAVKAAPASGGRARSFGYVAGAAAAGGLLLALGLLGTVLAPVKEKAVSMFTRMTRRGPALGAASEAAPLVADRGGLIRGQYEITRPIGSGGMGMVFEGTDRALGRRVAIKKMRDELRVNPQERARFVIEAKTVAALHHPNIVDIYAIAEEGPDVFLVFEYVDGATVHDAVQKAGRLDAAESARIVRAAADALGYAHGRGVIHRDVKPSNMMIETGGRVKVMDFGIARMAKDAMTRYSMTNTVVGTPPYMAPEQEQGQVRRESDVYALAVCAYEMLTGKLPFAGIGAGMLLNKINMSFVPPSRATAGVAEELDPVFQKALQADPEKRYRTPQEFADALESAVRAAARA